MTTGTGLVSTLAAFQAGRGVAPDPAVLAKNIRLRAGAKTACFPQAPDRPAGIRSRHHPGFTGATDTGHAFARRLGIPFTPDDTALPLRARA